MGRVRIEDLSEGPVSYYTATETIERSPNVGISLSVVLAASLSARKDACLRSHVKTVSRVAELFPRQLGQGCRLRFACRNSCLLVEHVVDTLAERSMCSENPDVPDCFRTSESMKIPRPLNGALSVVSPNCSWRER